MFKRYRFVALLVCAYVFACGIVGTACAAEGDTLTVYAKQLILDGSLNMAFYVPLDENDLKDETTKISSFTINSTAANSKFDKDVNITGYIKDGKFTEGTAPSEETGAEEATLYAFLVELTSVQMNDPITGTIIVGSKTGTVDSYTVWSYRKTA